MINHEYQPKDYLSHHVESFWELEASAEDNEYKNITIPPELNYDIIFIDHQISLRLSNHKAWTKIGSGVYFIGLLTQGLVYNIPSGVKVFGVKLKPFSLANIVGRPLNLFNNKIVRFQEIFDFNANELLMSIIESETSDQKITWASCLISRIIEKDNSINQTLRGELNYILNNKGNVKISEMQSVFNVSKVTLRDHFVNKIGLPAKVVSKIYRFHHSLELNYCDPSKSLTVLSLDAGYFDQSHYIKDFRSFFNSAPNHFFKTDNSINISQKRIVRRFADFYDPI